MLNFCSWHTAELQVAEINARKQNFKNATAEMTRRLLWEHYFFAPFTAVLRDAPALNAGALEALILRGAPVAGLRPLRAARLRTSNVPKPTNATLSPFFRVAVMILSLIHISEPTRLGMISYAVFCLKK